MPIGRTLLPIASGGSSNFANFSADTTTIEPSDTVQFTDLTTDITPTSWEWDFGDGEKSTLQNPQHRYKFSGQFTVTLIASDGTTTVFEQKEQYIDCSSPDWIVTIDTRITYDPIRNRFAATQADDEFRLQIRFNTTGAATSATVDWGDGTQDIISLGSGGVTGFVHTYATPGIYKVKLLASSASPGAPISWPENLALDNSVKIIEFNNWGSGINYNTIGGFAPHFRNWKSIFYANDKPANSSDISGAQLFLGTDWELTSQDGGRYIDHLFDGFDPIEISSVDQTFRLAGFGFNSDLSNITFNTALAPSIRSRQTFEGCSRFNRPLSHWIMTGTTSMLSMFSGARSFNQDISMWDTQNVTTFQAMFLDAHTFNQNISTWNVSSCGQFASMFQRARSFDQNLGSWPLRTAGTSMGNIFRDSGMSTENYTDTIVGWANYVFDNSGPINVSMTSQVGRTFTNSRPGGANFADAQAARAYLLTQGWSITSDTVVA